MLATEEVCGLTTEVAVEVMIDVGDVESTT